MEYGEHCKVLYTYLDIDEYKHMVKKKKAVVKVNIIEIQNQLKVKESVKKSKELHEEQMIYESILRKKIEKMRKEFKDTVPLAVAFFIKYGREVVYLESGSSTEYQWLKGS